MKNRSGLEVGAVLIYLFIALGMMMLGVITLTQETINVVDLQAEVSAEDQLVQSSFNKAAFQSLQSALFSTYNGTRVIDIVAKSIHCDTHAMYGVPNSTCSDIPTGPELQDIIAGRLELFDDPTYQLQIYTSKFSVDNSETENQNAQFLSASNGQIQDISGYTRFPFATYGDEYGYIVFRYENADYQVILR